MGYFDTIVFIMELVGTVAFASSGAMVGIEKHMDIFGVNVLGVTTAVGGGIFRDLILGIHPPMTFSDPVYAGVAALVSTLLFLTAYGNMRVRSDHMKHWLEQAMLLFDALGLGIFTVVGIQMAVNCGYGEGNRFLLVFVGVITGVGGGLIRDVMAGNRPYILVKHIYACASILGAIACVLLRGPLGELAAMIIGTAVVVLIRLLAIRYRWNLIRIPEQRANRIERKENHE